MLRSYLPLAIGALTAVVAAQSHAHDVSGAGASGVGASDQDDAQIVATRPGNTVDYEVGDALNMAYVERDRLVSVDVILRRVRSRFHGQIGHQPVEITMEGSHIGGHIGNRTIVLLAVRASGQLHVDGMFGARSIALVVDPRSLRGQVGLCRYELSLQRGAYAGRVFCGGAPLRMSLTIPVSLAARGDVEVAVLLTSLLVR